MGRLVPHGHNDATCDPALIDRWWAAEPNANVGISTGPSRLLVFDVDAHRGGLATLADLERRYGPLPQTYSVETPHGGRHYYFEAPVSHVFRCNQSAFNGIDVKATGGYVIAAGGTDVGAYTVRDNVEVADPPQWLLAELAAASNRNTSGGAPSGTGTSRHWVVDAMRGVAQGNRNSVAAKLAGHFCNAGLDPAVIEELLEAYAGRCRPPLDAGDARAVARSICATAGHTASDTVPFGEDAHSWSVRLSALPAADDLIPGLIREGSTVLVHGQPRAGKSLFLLELALAVCSGYAPFRMSEFYPARAASVFYITDEDSEVEVKSRLESLYHSYAGRSVQSLPASLTMAVRKGISLDDPRCQLRLIEEVREHQSDIVIFDPLRSVSSAVDQGPAEFQPLGKFFRRLMRETGCTVWAGHHDTKPINGRIEARARAQRASGGGVFAFFDSPIHLERLDDTPLRSLVTPTAYKHGETPRAFTFVLEGGVTQMMLWGERPTTAPAALSLSALVLNVVRNNSGITGNMIVKALGKSRQATFDAVRTLSTTGEIYRVGRNWHAR